MRVDAQSFAAQAIETKSDEKEISRSIKVWWNELGIAAPYCLWQSAVGYWWISLIYYMCNIEVFRITPAKLKYRQCTVEPFTWESRDVKFQRWNDVQAVLFSRWGRRGFNSSYKSHMSLYSTAGLTWTPSRAISTVVLRILRCSNLPAQAPDALIRNFYLLLIIRLHLVRFLIAITFPYTVNGQTCNSPQEVRKLYCRQCYQYQLTVLCMVITPRALRQALSIYVEWNFGKG